jgi:hypothetical protein
MEYRHTNEWKNRQTEKERQRKKDRIKAVKVLTLKTFLWMD